MKLRVRHPLIAEFSFALRSGRSTIIGRRAADVDVEFNWDTAVSRRHARVWMEEGQIWFEDLGSRNGSWFDGVRISEPTRLDPGMELRVGETRLVVPGLDVFDDSEEVTSPFQLA